MSSEWWTRYNPLDIHLYNRQAEPPPSDEVVEDGLAFLRRGQSNDPTNAISLAIQRLERDTQDLSQLIATMIPSNSRGQYRRHWEIMQQWFQSVAQKQGDRLKEILKVRANVLAEQAQRRKRFQANRGTTTKSAYGNPLFTIQAPPPSAPINQNISATTQHHTIGAGASSSSSNLLTPPPFTTSQPVGNGFYSAPASGVAAPRGYYSARGGYDGSSTNFSYTNANYHTTGMRQRRTTTAAASAQTDAPLQEQTQLLVRQQERQTQQRLQEARQAERSLAELGTLFGKMSSLIVHQGQVIENIEDDVEAAMMDVGAGHEEIQILYGIKKGNRALIIKVFGLLILMIIFMRIYKK
jgi:hypothetical protein